MNLTVPPIVLSKLSPWQRQIVLLAATVVSWALIALVAWPLAGALGLAAAGTAGVCCWTGAAGALAAHHWLGRRGSGLWSLLVGMGLRMGVPLAAGLILYWRSQPLAAAGLLYYFLAFYPVTLAVETILSLSDHAGASPPTQTPREGAS